MADLIDRAALLNSFERIAGRMKCETFHISLIETEIKDAPDLAPGVDVAVVIRCKDCKSWNRHIGMVDSPNGYCRMHEETMNGYDFCSYGERRVHASD